MWSPLLPKDFSKISLHNLKCKIQQACGDNGNISAQTHNSDQIAVEHFYAISKKHKIAKVMKGGMEFSKRFCGGKQ